MKKKTMYVTELICGPSPLKMGLQGLEGHSIWTPSAVFRLAHQSTALRLLTERIRSFICLGGRVMCGERERIQIGCTNLISPKRPGPR